MRNSSRAASVCLAACACWLLLAGCGQSGSGSASVKTQTAVSAEPVTLSASIIGITMSEELQKLVIDSVRTKYPHITLQLIPPGKGSGLGELIAAGQTPDIIFTYNGNVASLKEFNVLSDMTPLLKQRGIDLSRFDETILRDMKVSSTKDEIFGVPYKREFHALYYNKDIFDKFGVSYPKDGMTWDDVLDLGKKVTRLDNGIQYRGLDPGSGIAWVSQPLSLEYVNPQTEKAAMNNAGWKKVFELVKAIYAIPGNEPGKAPKTAFLSDKTLAILPGLNMFSELEAAAKNGLNWDVVQSPSYPEKMNVHGNASVEMMLVTPSSKYKEQAMQVAEVLVSDQFQLELSKSATTTVLKNPDIVKAFGANKPFLQGKNVQGIFKSKPVQYPIVSQYKAAAGTVASKKFEEFRAGNKDVNTILREADDEINKLIEQAKGK